MKGTRPLDNDEIRKVADTFEGTYKVRNRALFLLGVSVGGRISELLALKVGDLWQNSKPVNDLMFTKHIVKGGEVARAVPVNADGVQAIRDLIVWHQDVFSSLFMPRPAFPSRKNSGLDPIGRKAADDILNAAFERAGLNGKLGTHSLRKSYAQRLYDQTGDIFAVQEMLGHKSVETTQRYLGVNYKTVREASEAMAAIYGTPETNAFRFKKFSDDDMVRELARRGYDIYKSGNLVGGTY